MPLEPKVFGKQTIYIVMFGLYSIWFESYASQNIERFINRNKRIALRNVVILCSFCQVVADLAGFSTLGARGFSIFTWLINPVPLLTLAIFILFNHRHHIYCLLLLLKPLVGAAVCGIFGAIKLWSSLLFIHWGTTGALVATLLGYSLYECVSVDPSCIRLLIHSVAVIDLVCCFGSFLLFMILSSKEPQLAPAAPNAPLEAVERQSEEQERRGHPSSDFPLEVVERQPKEPSTATTVIPPRKKSSSSTLSSSSSSSSHSTNLNPLNDDSTLENCVVCLEKPIDALFYKCGHLVCCMDCAKSIQARHNKCPICRRNIVDVVRAYK